MTSKTDENCVLIDESTTISAKSVGGVFAVSYANAETQYFLTLSIMGPQQITEKLLAGLHKNIFDDHFMEKCFEAFVCQLASVILGTRVLPVMSQGIQQGEQNIRDSMIFSLQCPLLSILE